MSLTKVQPEMLHGGGPAPVVSAIPIGAGVDYYGHTLPTNYLLADGSLYDPAEYPELFAELGTTHGGDGVTSFAVPDKRDRVGVGRGDMGGTAAGRITQAASGVDTSVLGASGGVQAVTLTMDQMPNHGHTITDPGHSHSVGTLQGGGNSGSFGVGDNGNVQPAATDSMFTGITLANTGGGQAHTNLQPFLVCNHIIRAR